MVGDGTCGVNYDVVMILTWRVPANDKRLVAARPLNRVGEKSLRPEIPQPFLEFDTLGLILHLDENLVSLGGSFVRNAAHGGDHAKATVSWEQVKIDLCQSLPARSLRYCINNGTGLPVPPLGAARKAVPAMSRCAHL